MKALLVSSGSIHNLNLLKDLINKNDFIICADGGLNHLMKIQEVPDLVLGDFDSISQKALDYIEEKNIEVKKYPKEKDETDTELGISNIIKKGYKDITITGVTGTRMDHTIANIFLLKDLNSKGINAKIVDDNNSIYFVDDFLELRKTLDYISIIPINSEGVILTLKGFLYSLDREYLRFGSTMGISNIIKDTYGSVKIYKGEALVFQSRD